MEELQNDDARVNITDGGNNGDLPILSTSNTPDPYIKHMVTEAVRGGGVPGINGEINADFSDFVVIAFRRTTPVRIRSFRRAEDAVRSVGDRPNRSDRANGKLDRSQAWPDFFLRRQRTPTIPS